MTSGQGPQRQHREAWGRYGQQRDVNVLKNHSYLHPDGAFVPATAALLGLGGPVDPLLAP